MGATAGDERVILYLIRHGETAYNRDRLGLGRADVPLTTLGERQAAAIGARLAREPIERILVSPLGRAIATAQAVRGERPIELEIRDELRELDVGVTEGMTFPDMRERHPDFFAAWVGVDGADTVMPGGESLRHVYERVAPLIGELRAAPEGVVAVVSHNFVTKVAICQLLGLELDAWRSFATDIASVSIFDLRDGRAITRALNDTCHLEMDSGGGSTSG